MEQYSSVISYVNSILVTFLGAISLTEWAIISGIATGIGTFLVNWFYKHKELKERYKYKEKKHEESHY